MAQSQLPRVQSRVQDGVLVVTITEPKLHGDKVTHALRQDLQALVENAGVSRVVLDFRPVVSLSSEAFRPLLSLRRHLSEAGGRLVLCNLSPLVAQAFQATRLVGGLRTSSAAFEVQPDLGSAIGSLTSGPADTRVSTKR
jgi:anti-anti-sigma factor